MSPAAAERWLLEHLALYLDRDVAALDRGVPLVEYGLDSVCALCLCGDLEEDFDHYAEPALLWEHPTVDALVGYLAAQVPVGSE